MTARASTSWPPGRARTFDIVLLDIGLPFVDGWHVLSSLEGRRVPSVIVISARGDQGDKVRALDMARAQVRRLTTAM